MLVGVEFESLISSFQHLDALCRTLEYLVSGPVPVSDGDLTASSVGASATWDYGPAQARLNQEFGVPVGTKKSAGRWSPDTNDISQHIQVHFNI